VEALEMLSIERRGDGKAEIFRLANGPKRCEGVEQNGHWPRRLSISESVGGASRPSGRTKAPRAEPSAGQPCSMRTRRTSG